MYYKERMRVVQTIAVGVGIGLVGLALLLLILLKAALNPELSYRLAYSVTEHFRLFALLWNWLPAYRADLATAMLSVPFILGVCLMLLGAATVGRARNFWSVITEAERRSKIAGLLDGRHGISYKQSVGSISAGGDVTINQIAEANRKLDEWDHDFWKGPFGVVILAVVAALIAAVVTFLTGLTH